MLEDANLLGGMVHFKVPASISRVVSVSRTLGRPISYTPCPTQLAVALGLEGPKELGKKLVAES